MEPSDEMGRGAGRSQLALADGEVLTECSVATSAGVRVPDLAWASPAFMDRHGDTTSFPAAPELCVEVISPSNRKPEMAEKVTLYLGAGAQEVWLVEEDGSITPYGPEGRRAGSIFAVPGVPLPS